MLIMGIETSCDETGIALYDSEAGLIANVLHSQIPIHARFGGVVPELASRDHIRKLVPLVRQALGEGNRPLAELDAIAYTAGPGLMGALLVGASFARSLAWGLDIPAVPINHMEAHLLAPLLEARSPNLPFIALLVSGGHTQLVFVQAIGDYQILGESVDDAAGEAFDKVAKMLDLGYPGGPAVAQLASEGEPGAFTFPRPMTDRPGFDLSFSGLKTAVLTQIKKQGHLTQQIKANICRGFEEAVVATLVIKCRRVLEHTNCNQLVIAGGVSANTRLRESLTSELNAEIFYARPDLCTDNGAMIAYAGYWRVGDLPTQLHSTHNLVIDAKARWPIDELQPLN